MKEKILHYFKHDRSHNSGVKLYNEFGNRMSFKRQLNFQPENDHLTATLHEELRVLAGISQDEFRVIMMNPVTPAPAVSAALVGKQQKKKSNPRTKPAGGSRPAAKKGKTGKKPPQKKSSGRKKSGQKKPVQLPEPAVNG